MNGHGDADADVESVGDRQIAQPPLFREERKYCDGHCERLLFIEVISFDWACQKYITPRYTAAEVEKAVEPLRQRIAELEAQLKVQN